MNNNFTSFLVFRSSNIKVLSVLDVYKSINLILEDLEPLGIGAPYLHVIGLSRTLDVPWLVVILRSDCQWLLMEVPLLGVSSIWSLDDHVSVVDQIKVSSWCHSCNNVEWSFDVKSKVFIEFSLSRFTLPFIYIDYIPLLVESSVFRMNDDISVFSINVSLDV